MRNNRQISLADVVSVEAWYETFCEETRESDFFLHIKFQDGAFGGNPDLPVRFKIRLRNAKVTIIPEEPITVPRKLIRRDRIEVEARITRTEERATSASASGTATARVSTTGGSASIEGTAEAQSKISTTDKVEASYITHSGMHIEHDVVDGHNRWSFAPALGPHLTGQAFHETKPLMKLVHKPDFPKIPATVKVRVTCLGEDIDVLALEPKEKNIWNRGMGKQKKLNLAREIIRTSLANEGLEFEGELDDHSTVTIAEAFAAEE